MSITFPPQICPTEDHISFPSFHFTATYLHNSLLVFHFSPSYDTILHIAVIIIFYLGSRVFFLLLLLLFFLIISNFIFYNYLNSIQRLIYDTQRKGNTYTMTKYYLFCFSFHAFLLDFAGCNLFFFFICRSSSFFFFFPCLFSFFSWS